MVFIYLNKKASQNCYCIMHCLAFSKMDCSSIIRNTPFPKTLTSSPGLPHMRVYFFVRAGKAWGQGYSVLGKAVFHHSLLEHFSLM